MADKPITFSAPMVRALLAGTKTQTRRLIEPTKDANIKPGDILMSWPADQFIRQGARFRPRYLRGDRVYVREHWRVSDRWDDTAPRDLKPRSMTIFCEAGGSIANQSNGKWEPDDAYPVQRPDWLGRHRQGMHMPRWASRMWLGITDVRVQRLQDISEADCVAEGIEHVTTTASGDFYQNFQNPDCPLLAYGAYRSLWDHINGDGAWEANPWIVAYSFTVHHGNIDGSEHNGFPSQVNGEG